MLTTTKIEQIFVLFKCNICSEVISNVSSGLQHFKFKHFGAHIDTVATKFILRFIDGSVQIIKLFQSFYIQQHMMCYLCDTILSSKYRATCRWPPPI